MPGLRAFAHVTGGGLAANVARITPQRLAGTVARDSWTVPPVFDVLRAAGDVPWRDLEATLNLGVGMVAVVAPDDVDALAHACESVGVAAWPVGAIVLDDGREMSADTVRGAKGVDGGAVYLGGSYRVT